MTEITARQAIEWHELRAAAHTRLISEDGGNAFAKGRSEFHASVAALLRRLSTPADVGEIAERHKEAAPALESASAFDIYSPDLLEAHSDRATLLQTVSALQERVRELEEAADKPDCFGRTLKTTHDGDCSEAGELAPCPFCGGAPFLLQIGNAHTKSWGYDVGCIRCAIKKKVHSKHDTFEWCRSTAIAFWNRRASRTLAGEG